MTSLEILLALAIAALFLIPKLHPTAMAILQTVVAHIVSFFQKIAAHLGGMVGNPPPPPPPAVP